MNTGVKYLHFDLLVHDFKGTIYITPVIFSLQSFCNRAHEQWKKSFYFLTLSFLGHCLWYPCNIVWLAVY